MAAVVLAAGSSSRLGRPKQLLEVEGQTLIRRTVQTVLASAVDAVVVATSLGEVNFDAELHGLNWTRATVEHSQLGQSESVRAGLQTVESLGNFDAILFTPCDLPLLSATHLNALVEKYQRGLCNIVASRYDGVLGAPLILDRELWPELRALRGDTGVRKILPSHKGTTTFIEWEAGKFDLDTPDDVKAFSLSHCPPREAV